MRIVHFPNEAPDEFLVDEDESVIVNGGIELIPSILSKFGLVDCYALIIHLQGVAFKEGQPTLAESGCLGEIGPEMAHSGRFKGRDRDSGYWRRDLDEFMAVVLLKGITSVVVFLGHPTLLRDQCIIIV